MKTILVIAAFLAVTVASNYFYKQVVPYFA